MFLLALAAQSGFESSGSMLKSFPHDASAIVIYVLIAAFVGVIWAGSRKRT